MNTQAPRLFHSLQTRFCKHVRGLLEFGVLEGQSVDQLQPRARLGA